MNKFDIIFFQDSPHARIGNSLIWLNDFLLLQPTYADNFVFPFAVENFQDYFENSNFLNKNWEKIGNVYQEEFNEILNTKNLKKRWYGFRDKTLQFRGSQYYLVSGDVNIIFVKGYGGCKFSDIEDLGKNKNSSAYKNYFSLH